MTQTFKVGDRVRKTTGSFAPYEMIVTSVRDKHDGQHIRGDIVSGGYKQQQGIGGDVSSRYELVQSVEPTDAELAEAMREAHLKALDLGDQLKVRGYTVKVGEMNDWRRVTIYRDEVKRVTL